VVSGAVTRRYAHGPMRVSQSQLISGNGTTHHYGYDTAGTVRQLTNGSGAVTDTYDYDAYGLLIAQTGSTPNLYLYRGEQWDPSLELYCLRARWMQPRIGRFLTADKYEGEDDHPPSLHKYGYGSGDPVAYTDPTGNSSTEKSLLSSILLRIEALIPRVALGGVTLERVRRGARTAYLVACCLDRAWSVLDLAGLVGGLPHSTALDLIDAACLLGCGRQGLTPLLASDPGPLPGDFDSPYFAMGKGGKQRQDSDEFAGWSPEEVAAELEKAKRDKDKERVRKLEKQQKALGVRNKRKRKGC
jgi:RHS repeat-associated protein